jgi:hypothetical protein
VNDDVGYRTLLKKYIRFIERRTGNHQIDEIEPTVATWMSRRDVAELRTIAREIRREDEDREAALSATRRANPPRPGLSDPT